MNNEMKEAIKNIFIEYDRNYNNMNFPFSDEVFLSQKKARILF